MLFTGSNEVLLEERFKANAKMYAAENLYDMLDDLINARGHPCQKKACLSRGETDDENAMEITLLEKHIKLRHK